MYVYSLVKMVYGFVEKSKKKPTWHEMLHAIKRNFGGLDQVDPVESFRNNLQPVVQFDPKVRYKNKFLYVIPAYYVTVQLSNPFVSNLMTTLEQIERN